MAWTRHKVCLAAIVIIAFVVGVMLEAAIIVALSALLVSLLIGWSN